MLDRRINRISFWAAMVPLLIVEILLNAVGVHLPFWIPTVVVCVYRLHDLGRTGKWTLLPLILQNIATVCILINLPPHQVSAGLFAVSAVTLLAMIWLGSEPGEPISNAWGGPQAPGLSFGRAA